MEQVLGILDTLRTILIELSCEKDLTSRAEYLLYEAEDLLDEVKESLTDNS